MTANQEIKERLDNSNQCSVRCILCVCLCMCVLVYVFVCMRACVCVCVNKRVCVCAFDDVVTFFGSISIGKSNLNVFF